MENPKKFSFFKKPATLSQAELHKQEILDAIKDTHYKLTTARICFDNVSDPELVEASVFEINSLQARYSYLLRKAREEGCNVSTAFRAPR